MMAYVSKTAFLAIALFSKAYVISPVGRSHLKTALVPPFLAKWCSKKQIGINKTYRHQKNLKLPIRRVPLEWPSVPKAKILGN